MGLSASQARLLSITSRKADCEFMSMMLSHQKMALSRDMEKVSDDYQNALSQTKLVYDYYGANNQQSDLSYNLLMSPSAYNDYSPKLISNTQNNIVLNGAIAEAARAAGIPNEGYCGTPSSDIRNKFVSGLVGSGVISNATALSIQNVKYNNMAGLGATDALYDSTMDITYDQLLENIKANCYSTEESGLTLGGFYALQDNEFADWYLLSGRGKNGYKKDQGSENEEPKYSDDELDDVNESYKNNLYNDQSDAYLGTGLYIVDSKNGQCVDSYVDKWTIDREPLSTDKHSYDLTLEELLNGDYQFNFSICTNGQAVSDIAYLQQLLVGTDSPDCCSFLNWMTDQFQIVLGGTDQNNMALQYAYNAVYDLIYPNEDAQEMAGTKDMRQDVFTDYYAYIEEPLVNYLPTGQEGVNKKGDGDWNTVQYSAQNYLGITKSGYVFRAWDPNAKNSDGSHGAWVDSTWLENGTSDSPLIKELYDIFKNNKNTSNPEVPRTDDFSYWLANMPGIASWGHPALAATRKAMGLGSSVIDTANPFQAVSNTSTNTAITQSYGGSLKLSINLNNLAKMFLTAYTEYINGIENSNYLYNTNNMQYLNLYKPKSDDIFTVAGEISVDGEANLAATFYDTMFNLICTHGWTENDQIDDKDYLQNMLKSGLLLISSAGSDETYYQQSYTNDVYVVEVTDTDAVAQAEAKYNSEKNRIEAKENKINIKMKNLDTELSSLTTEYDTVKSLISKTIEKTIKRYDA